MTEQEAEKALRWLAKELGPNWKAGADVSPVMDCAGIRPPIGVEYGGEISLCRGWTWAEAVEAFTDACGKDGVIAGFIPKRLRACSAEELLLKMAVDGLLQETPGKTVL